MNTPGVAMSGDAVRKSACATIRMNLMHGYNSGYSSAIWFSAAIVLKATGGGDEFGER